MLDQLTLETFRPLVGETFRVIVDERWEMHARLTSVDTWAERPDRTRQPFSLFFHGPLESSLPQRIYRVESDRLEPMELFLVPLGPDEQGSRYEAAFT